MRAVWAGTIKTWQVAVGCSHVYTACIDDDSEIRRSGDPYVLHHSEVTASPSRDHYSIKGTVYFSLRLNNEAIRHKYVLGGSTYVDKRFLNLGSS
jgi:hypothetical protein